MTMCVKYECPYKERFGMVSLTNFFIDKIFIVQAYMLQHCRSLVQEAGLEILKTIQIEFGSNSNQIELLKMHRLY